MAKRGSRKSARQKPSPSLEVDLLWPDLEKDNPELTPVISAAHKKISDFQERNPNLTKNQMAEFFLFTIWEAMPGEKTPYGGSLLHSLVFESDRGCVLVAAAIIDRELEMLFREHFRATSEATSEEMDVLLSKRPEPPLQSTWRKIHLAYCLGLINGRTKEALLAMQSLRSTVAAHTIKSMRLSPQSVARICQEFDPAFKSIFDGYVKSETFAKMCAKGFPWPIASTKLHFGFVVLILLAQIVGKQSAIASRAKQAPASDRSPSAVN